MIWKDKMGKFLSHTTCKPSKYLAAVGSQSKSSFFQDFSRSFQVPTQIGLLADLKAL